MDPILETVILFVISLLISAIIIYFVTKIFGEKEGFLCVIGCFLSVRLLYRSLLYLAVSA
jgi:hypothetical protein